MLRVVPLGFCVFEHHLTEHKHGVRYHCLSRPHLSLFEMEVCDLDGNTPHTNSGTRSRCARSTQSGNALGERDERAVGPGGRPFPVQSSGNGVESAPDVCLTGHRANQLVVESLNACDHGLRENVDIDGMITVDCKRE